MIELPDEVILSKITSRCAYRDEKSIENIKPTPPPKRKFKLSGGKILEQYLFHPLTTRSSACRQRVTLVINPEHWENKINDEYLNQISYCDLRKFDLLLEEDVLFKCRDRENGFEYVAKLCYSKCQELLKLNIQLRIEPDVSDEIKNVIDISIADIVADEIITKLEEL